MKKARKKQQINTYTSDDATNEAIKSLKNKGFNISFLIKKALQAIAKQEELKAESYL